LTLIALPLLGLRMIGGRLAAWAVLGGGE